MSDGKQEDAHDVDLREQYTHWKANLETWGAKCEKKKKLIEHTDDDDLAELVRKALNFTWDQSPLVGPLPFNEVWGRELCSEIKIASRGRFSDFRIL